ncbi:MAG: hypothetical protein Q4F67_05485 [Propionibacteriaceae bacterium]|nr:hypothetical protein [Propionibacteriaceae bacterium]
MCVGLVDPATWSLSDFSRHPLDSAAPLAGFLATVRTATRGLNPPQRWAVAIPGPFDYARGIGGVHPAGKLAGLAGVEVRPALAEVLSAAEVAFVNDAAAFAAGQAVTEPGISRLLALTFGSGIGSTFIEGGRPVLDDRVPPGGEVYCLPAGTATIESRFGPAALAAARGCDSFRALSAYAREDAVVADSVRADFVGLADALAPWLVSFAPELVVCGGGVCHAWDLFGEAFTERLRAHAGAGLRVVAVTDTERVALRGAVALTGVE